MKINVNKSSFVSEVDENKVAGQKKVSKVSNEPLGKKLRNKMRANGNLILKVMFFIMIAFYVFSFSSNYIFAPKEADLLYTPLKQDNPIDNLNVQINDWKYSKSQNMMEVDLTLDDESADLYDLSFLSKARMTGNELQNLDSKVMYQSSSYIVIFIKDIPENYNEVLLSVTSELKTNNSSESVSLYTNRYKATKVDKIAKKTDIEYQVDRLNIGLENYQNKIDSSQKKINNYNKTITDSTKEIEKLREEQQYLTTDEIAESEDKISAFQQSIKSANDSIKSEQDKSRTYQQKLDEIKLKIKEIKN